MTSNDAFRKCLLEMIRFDNFRQIQANLFQFSSSWPFALISGGINFHQFLQKHVLGNKFLQSSWKLWNFLPMKVAPLEVVYQYTFQSCYKILMRQNLVLYGHLYKRVEYLIFVIFPPALSLSLSLSLRPRPLSSTF